tara:strand:+ start:274 stop:2220 length:1947 start_codon:yes stop_codon:yes gene_type:complete
MAQENLDFNINVKTNGAEGSLGSLKKQLREAQADVTALSDKFGATSKQAIEAAKRAGELRDKIGDAKALTDAFNPDAKFKSLTASLSGVAGGFGAVQGAMALFGNESENVQKTLLKVQSAMAISQGLQSVGESIDSFRQLGAVIKSTSVYQAAYNFIMGDAVEVAQEAVVSIEAETVALSSEAAATVAVTTATTGATIAMRIFRAALIATGIGAVVVLVGLLIEALSSLTSSTKEAKDAQDKLNESIATQNEILDSNITKIKRAGELRISELKKNGATEAEIYKEQRINDTLLLDEYLKNKEKKYNLYQEELKKNGKSTDKEILANLDKFRKEAISADNQYENQKLKLQVDANNEIARVNKDAEDKRKAAIEKKKIEDEKAAEKAKKDALDLANFNKNRNEQISNDDKELREDGIRLQKEADERDAAAALESKNASIAAVQYRTNLIVTSNETIRQNDKELKDALLQAEIELNQAKYDNAQNALYLLEGLAGRNEQLANIIFAVSKALEIGKIISSTASAIVGVKAGVAAVPAILPPGVPNPAYVVAAGIGAGKISALKIGAGISIASIAATSIARFKSGGGGDVGGGGSIGGAAPIVPQLPTAQTTNISQQSINDIGNQAVRAYVIESDVTSNQQRIAAIRQRARFS